MNFGFGLETSWNLPKSLVNFSVSLEQSLKVETALTIFATETGQLKIFAQSNALRKVVSDKNPELKGIEKRL